MTQLETALTSRSVIDQAKGAVRTRTGCTADEAFASLVDMSQRRNIKLRDVAEQLLDDYSDA
jgi:AmiR/NasT family two-component response regulator